MTDTEQLETIRRILTIHFVNAHHERGDDYLGDPANAIEAISAAAKWAHRTDNSALEKFMQHVSGSSRHV